MKKQKNKTNWERRVIVAEAVFVFGIFIYLFFSMAPSIASPIAGKTILEPDLVFEVGEGEEILISPNEDFENPIILKQDSDLQLPPGTYYWKIKNWLRESKVSTFIIETNVGLSLYNRPENYELENSGNVDLDVTKNKAGITSDIPLETGESIEVEKDDSEYIGGQR